MKLRYVFAAMSMLAFVSLVAWAYNKVVIQGDKSLTVPLIKAADGPYKILPDDPGGMDIPHLDSTIYNALDENHRDTEERPVFKDDAGDTDHAAAEADDTESATALKQGFVLEPRSLKTDEKPKVESLFSDRDKAIEMAKQNIEREEDTRGNSASSQAMISDDDIRSMERAEDQGTEMAPEEVDAGIIIPDAAAGKDDIKAPRPTAKPKSLAEANAAKDDAAAPPQSFENVLKSLQGEDVQIEATDNMRTERNGDAASAKIAAALEPVHDYVLKSKPAAPAAASGRHTAYTISGADGTASSAAIASVSGGDYVIQLASVPSKAAAQREWSSLKSRYSSVLGALSPRYPQIDLGDKGVYTRIQAGPLDEAAARGACAALVAAGRENGCIVVKK